MDDFEERKQKAKQRKQLRLDICSQCEHIDIEKYVCNLCGCAMRVKTGFRDSVCPIEKW